MAETSTIFGFMKYVSATDILSDFKKTVDSYFVNSLKCVVHTFYFLRTFAPKPLRKINVYSCSKQRLWTSKDRPWTLQQ